MHSGHKYKVRVTMAMGRQIMLSLNLTFNQVNNWKISCEIQMFIWLNENKIDHTSISPPAPPPGGEKKIVIVGPGAGPWSVGSQQVATWWSTGFDSDLGLKPADPTIKGIGSVFTVTEGGDGPAAPELGLLGTPANNPPPPDKPPTATPAPPPGKLGICTQI
ncbi:hypothetical protein RhiirC2_710251 [Rhizophagus irregularis]|uniref:Uncharacterized protein n=1 Tax=Rhizophagus irregularis TaxID=588596 RepID=A0A2N1NF99_9GLOM|nr:hypothetical protein RhiirC2_710251 [Rhizophagus irregularis]